jgi:hypothetical protein
MKKAWSAAALVVLMAGCAQQREPGYDDAIAACDSEALAQMDSVGVEEHERNAWRENYVRQCMQTKGFEQ